MECQRRPRQIPGRETTYAALTRRLLEGGWPWLLTKRICLGGGRAPLDRVAIAHGAIESASDQGGPTDAGSGKKDDMSLATRSTFLPPGRSAGGGGMIRRGGGHHTTAGTTQNSNAHKHPLDGGAVSGEHAQVAWRPWVLPSSRCSLTRAETAGAARQQAGGRSRSVKKGGQGRAGTGAIFPTIRLLPPVAPAPFQGLTTPRAPPTRPNMPPEPLDHDRCTRCTRRLLRRLRVPRARRASMPPMQPTEIADGSFHHRRLHQQINTCAPARLLRACVETVLEHRVLEHRRHALARQQPPGLHLRP